MQTVQIRVTDTRGKYSPKTYKVEAKEGSPEFLWYGPAVENFIRDNNHPARKPTQRASQYYSRFYAQVV